MQCLLVYADPNSGKTALLRRYCKLHPINQNWDRDAIHAPVIGIEIRSPDEGALYDVEKKRHQVLTILEKIGTRQLLIDELNAVIAGPLLKQRKFLIALKNLLNELEMTAFATGTPDARIALVPDPQLESRFEMEELQRWTDGEEFRKLLESFECRLPLREQSGLQAPIFHAILHQQCRLIVSERTAPRFREFIRERLNCPDMHLLSGLPFEMRTMVERHHVVAMAMWMMSDLRKLLASAWKSSGRLVRHRHLARNRMWSVIPIRRIWRWLRDEEACSLEWALARGFPRCSMHVAGGI
jgi:hypothetical protein